MKRILFNSLLALSIAVSINACGATAQQLNKQQSAEQTATGSTFPLATLRRDFKDSLPIPIGEKLEYEVKFSRFPFPSSSVGVVTFEYLGTIGGKKSDETQPAVAQTQPLITGLNVEFFPQPGDQFLHLRATAISKGFLISLFGVDVKDRFETLADTNDLSAHVNLIELKEGKKHSVQSTIYDRTLRQVKYLTTDMNKPGAPPKTKFLPLKEGMMSLLSAFYFVRLQKYKEGQMLRFPVSADEGNYQFDVLVGKREKIRSACGKLQSIKLEPKLFGPGQFFYKTKGEMTMWITDNKRHVPLQLIAKTPSGTITAKLTNYNNRKKNCQIDDPETEGSQNGVK